MLKITCEPFLCVSGGIVFLLTCDHIGHKHTGCLHAETACEIVSCHMSLQCMNTEYMGSELLRECLEYALSALMF